MVHMQSCCFANQTYCFLTFSLLSTSLDLKVPIYYCVAAELNGRSKTVMTLKHNLLMMFIAIAIHTLNIMTMMMIIRHLKSICKYSCGILSFQNSGETSIMIDHALQHNTSLQNADRGISDLLSSGSSILKSLRDQRVTLKVCS